MAELPIVCTLNPGDFNARAANLFPGLVTRATRREAIEGGIRFELVASSENLQSLVNMIDAERQCCRFLRFGLIVEPDGGPISLDVTGPPGTKQFLDALIENA